MIVTGTCLSTGLVLKFRRHRPAKKLLRNFNPSAGQHRAVGSVREPANQSASRVPPVLVLGTSVIRVILTFSGSEDHVGEKTAGYELGRSKT